MKLKAQLTIDINQYENLKPEIEIDTDKLDEAVELIKELHNKFHKICDGTFERQERRNEQLAEAELNLGLNIQEDKDNLEANK